MKATFKRFEILRFTVVICMVALISAFCSRASYAASGPAKTLRDVEFTYNAGGEEPFGYGLSRCDTYDIAIRVAAPTLIGGRVKSMRVPLPEQEGCSLSEEAKVWISSSLPIGEIDAANTLACLKAETGTGSLRCNFPDGIIIPAEGLYVGYTVTVDALAEGVRKFPIAVVNGSEPGSLYYRTTRNSRWDETFSRMEYMSAMTVEVEMEVPQWAVSPALPSSFRVKGGEPCQLSLRLLNTGDECVNNVRYELRIAGHSESGEIMIEDSESFTFRAERQVTSVFTAPEDFGDALLEFDIIEVNGRENEATNPSAKSTVRVLPVIPVARPLVDEYTGFWCGNCPPGWVALEESKDRYGDKFVFVAYHINDALSTSMVPYPIQPSSVPTVVINRGKVGTVNDIYTELPDLIDMPADVAIDVSLRWADSGKSGLMASTTLTFVEEPGSMDYKLELILVCDHLSNPAWGQTNYSAGLTGKKGKYWDIFTKGGAVVYGLEYNSVPALYLSDSGLKGNLPERIEVFKPYTLSGLFNLESGESMRGVDLTRNREALRVVALLIDSKTKRVVNAASSPLSAEAETAEAGLRGALESEEAIVSVTFYDLQGYQLAQSPVGQPYIKVLLLSDGSSRIEKSFDILPK